MSDETREALNAADPAKDEAQPQPEETALRPDQAEDEPERAPRKAKAAHKAHKGSKKHHHKKKGRSKPLPKAALIASAAVGLIAMAAALVLSRTGAGAYGGLFPLSYVSAIGLALGGLCLCLTMCFFKKRKRSQVQPFIGLGGVFVVLSLIIQLMYVGFGWELIPVGARSVALSGRGLTDITPLRRMTRLETALLSNNDIADITPLSGLKSLEYADLTGNPIADGNGTPVREALPQCVILSSASDNATRRISLYDRQLPGFDALVGALRSYRALEVVDLRGSMLAKDQIARLRQLFPSISFLSINTPDGAAASREDDTVILQVTSAEDAAQMLDRFGAVRHATLTGTLFTPEEYRALVDGYPNVDIDCQIRIYGRSWPTDAHWIDMSECQIDDRLIEYLGLFRNMESLNLPEMEPSAALSVMHAEPDIYITYRLSGQTVSDETTELDVRGRGVPDPNWVTALKQTAPALTRLRIDDADATQRATLAAAQTGVSFIYNITMLDITFSTDAETIDFGERPLTDAECAELEAIFPYMLRLKTVNMFESTLSQETMDHLFDTYPDIFFGWTFTICNGGWTMRSDITAFSTLKTERSKKWDTEDFRNLRFARNLMALDLGHNNIDDISWLANYPHMRILILADNKISDFSVLAQLTELEYAELFINEMATFDCLANHEHLIDLNVCFCMAAGQTTGQDIAPLLTCKNLERLWIAHNSLSWDQITQLREGLPNTQIVYSGESTGNGWRDHDRFPVMISIFKTRIYRGWDEPAPDVDLHLEVTY